MGFSKFWKDLLPHEKWVGIGFPLMVLGIVLMSIGESVYPDGDTGMIGITSVLLTVVALIILLFVALPLSIKNWRKGRKGFWHE